MEEELLKCFQILKPDKPTEDAMRKEQVDAFRGSPMTVGTLEEIIDDDHGIVTSVGGIGEHYVRISSIVDKDLLDPGCTVLLKTAGSGLVTASLPSCVVGVLQEGTTDFKGKGPFPEIINTFSQHVEGPAGLKMDKAPSETYTDVGGLEQQIEELKEVVELPLTKPEIYEEMGIVPPKGVILYGPPGTGKTLLAKGLLKLPDTFTQRYSGEGPKLVRELFKTAEENAPSIIFLDEIDSVGTKRYDTTCGGEKEVQRILLELLNQLDGFESRAEVKVIMSTNRIESLDPALIRPGRIDRKIEIPMPDEKTLRKIFQLHSAQMNLSKDVNVEEFLKSRDLTGADIKAICTEAGMVALRARRNLVTMEDFRKAHDSHFRRKLDEAPEGMYL